MFLIEFDKIEWRYWFAIVILLTLGVLGWQSGLVLAVLLSLIQLVHMVVAETSVKSFPVQVRAAYFVLLALFYWEPLRGLYWIPVVGTWARVLFGYCFLARNLSLLPWNRKEPLTPDLIKRTYLTPPIKGNILQGL